MRLISGLTLAVLITGMPRSEAAKPTPPPAEAVVHDEGPPASMIKAAQARIELAEQRVKLVQASYQKGTVPLDAVITASRLVMVAYRESPGLPEKLVEIAEKYRQATAGLVELTERRFKLGAIGEVDLTAARYALAEAEFWLEEAKWKLARKKTN